MTTQTVLLNVMSEHQGADKGIGAAELAAKLGVSPRRMRRLVSAARNEGGYAICAHPSTGYYMAVKAEEMQRCTAFLRNRAMHSLRLESRMRNVSLPDLLGQLLLNQA